MLKGFSWTQKRNFILEDINASFFRNIWGCCKFSFSVDIKKGKHCVRIELTFLYIYIKE